MLALSDMTGEFRAKARRLLDAAEDGLMRLAEDQAGPETVHTVFRAVHALRAGAGFLGMARLRRLARRMEEMADLIRNQDLEPGRPVVDVLVQALDAAASLLGAEDESGDIDIQGPVQALKAVKETLLDQQTLASLEEMTSPPAASGLPRFRISRYVLEHKREQGNLYLLRLDLDPPPDQGPSPSHLINELSVLGEVLDSAALEDVSGGALNRFEVLYATVLEKDLLAAGLGLGPESIRPISPAGWGEPEEASPGGAGPEPPAPAPEHETAPVQRAAPHAREPGPPQAEPADLEFLTFSLAGVIYGVEVLKVQEIIALPPVSRLPRSPRFVLGVINLRGMVVPVMDLRLRLGLPAAQGMDPVAVLLNLGSKVVGALVDEVTDLIQVGPGSLREPPEFAGPVNREDLCGLISLGREMVILPDLERLLSPEETVHAA